MSTGEIILILSMVSGIAIFAFTAGFALGVTVQIVPAPREQR